MIHGISNIRRTAIGILRIHEPLKYGCSKKQVNSTAKKYKRKEQYTKSMRSTSAGFGTVQ